MIKIKIADIPILIMNRYPYTEEYCKDYITDEPEQFTVSVSDEDIENERKVAEYQGAGEDILENTAIFRKIAEKGYKIVLTTDHGTIRVDNPIQVVGDKNTNTNLRYKVGKNLSYNPKQVYEIKQPERFGLPSPNVSSAYIFATSRDFLAYRNNYYTIFWYTSFHNDKYLRYSGSCYNWCSNRSFDCHIFSKGGSNWCGWCYP